MQPLGVMADLVSSVVNRVTKNFSRSVWYLDRCGVDRQLGGPPTEPKIKIKKIGKNQWLSGSIGSSLGSGALKSSRCRVVFFSPPYDKTSESDH